MDSSKTTCTIPCNLCGSREAAEEISRVDRDGNYLRTVICRNCGLVWSDPRPNEEEIKNYYTKDYRILYKGTYAPKLKHVYRAGRVAEHRYLFLKEILKKDSQILDVGSGGGEFVYLMRALGYDARGIEPNEGYGAYARDELGLPIEIGMAQQFDLPENSFDVITMHHVFEHLDDPALMLERMRAALRPEGFLVIEVPNVEGTCYAPLHRFHAAHLYNFNRATLEAVGRKGGFSVHKSVVSEDGGVITTIFQKSETKENIDSLPGNYERVAGVIKSHTPASHYLTLHPYLRPFRKLKMRAGENAAVKKASNGKEVLDEIVSKYQDGSGKF